MPARYISSGKTFSKLFLMSFIISRVSKKTHVWSRRFIFAISWNYRILSAEPSTECQYGEHTLSLQRFCGVPSVCALLHVAFGNSFPDHVLLSESMLKLAPKIHLTLTKTLSPYSPPRRHDVNIAQFFVISTVI